MWKWIVAGIALLAVVLFGVSLVDLGGGEAVSASAALLAAPEDITGYARAIDPYDWHFPADYGPHPDYQTEWWYYTGNLADETGRRFGFQFTIFRRAIAPQAAASDSDWRTNQVYMAHLTLTDVAADRFYEQQRFSRGAAGLAGATVDPVYRVWLEDWQVMAADADRDPDAHHRRRGRDRARPGPGTNQAGRLEWRGRPQPQECRAGQRQLLHLALAPADGRHADRRRARPST